MDLRHYYPKKLSSLREGAGLTQEGLADEFGVVKMTILRAEKGRSASYGLLVKYAARFGLTVTELLRPHPATLAEVNANERAEAAL